MELKYIYIKEFKNLINIDFNFNHSGSENFSFVNSDLKFQSKKNNSPSSFFAPNIKSLNAIVGKNGTGKTNLSEFLNYNLAHVGSGLVVYMTGKGIIIVDNKIFVQEDIVITNKNELVKFGYEIILYKEAPLDKNSSRQWGYLDKNKYIYYSPNMDYRFLYKGYGLYNMINISTSYLLKFDVYDSYKYIANNRYSWDRKEKTDSLYAHFRNEKIRESDIILNYEQLKEFINLPKICRISVDRNAENNLLNQEYISSPNENEKQINENYRDLAEIFFMFEYHFLEVSISTENAKNGYETYNIKGDNRKKAFRKVFLTNFFKAFLFIKKKPFPTGFLTKFILNDNYELKDHSLLADLEKLKSKMDKVINLYDWEDIKAEILESSLSVDNERENQIYNLYSNVVIDVSVEKNKKLLLELISHTKKLLNNQFHFHYEFFHQLSSGEQNLLNFFSRFYFAKSELLEIERDSLTTEGERIVIFIDEGEVAFHPEWQRRFFNIAIEYLSNLFEDREVQLIITSHSPFVLSDIPKENVIFLNKNEKGDATKENLNHDQTFGANIYSLLSDSFFMENGTIGEFAKKKIKWAVEVLKGERHQMNPEILNEVDYIIANLGEPIIKQQLEIMRNNFVNQDKVSALEKRVQELEDELRKNESNDND